MERVCSELHAEALSHVKESPRSCTNFFWGAGVGGRSCGRVIPGGEACPVTSRFSFLSWFCKWTPFSGEFCDKVPISWPSGARECCMSFCCLRKGAQRKGCLCSMTSSSRSAASQASDLYVAVRLTLAAHEQIEISFRPGSPHLIPKMWSSC